MVAAQSRELVLTPGDGGSDLKTGSVFFIGTATVLLRYSGFTILTDPNFLHRHEKARLGYGLSSRRLTDPALDLADLPPIDLVLLSHFHEDHFDRLVQRDLDRRLPIVTNSHGAVALRRQGFVAVQELDTWETLTVAKGEARLRITAVPGTHGPGILGKLLPPVMGSVLEFGPATGGTAFRMYVTGDTLVFKRLKEIPQRFPDIDLALLHLGGTRAYGVLVTMDGKQGVEAIRIVDPALSIPIHYNDYTVFKSPLEDFRKEVEAAGLTDRVRYLAHGETYAFDVLAGRGA